MLYFTGDINLTDNAFDVGYGVGTQIKNGLNPFRFINKNPNDIWVGNFEGVTADISNREGIVKDIFRLPVQYLKNTDGLIDYYSVANNHVMEHGPEGYRQMCYALENACSGIFGSNEKKTTIFNHQGKTISVTGFSFRNDQINHVPEFWNFPSIEDIRNEILALKENDYKIAYVHWGVEFINYPYRDQQTIAHSLIDAGFDMVVGMHPHVMQGYEVYKDKYIFYSLGNFVFNMAWQPTRYGAVVKLDLETKMVGYEYVRIDSSFCPHIISEADVPEEYRMETLCSLVPNYDNIEVYISKASLGLKSYRKANYKSILANIHKSNICFTYTIVKDFIKRRLFK